MSTVVGLVGMHRSGTSLLAQWLYHSGLFLGDELMLNQFDNPRGHFEDWTIVQVHENDLRLKGLSTTGLYLRKNEFFSLETASIDALKRIVEKRKVHEFWGWKDPRGTLFLNDWLSLAKGNFVCIATFRHYSQVVDSLLRRYKKALFEYKTYRWLNRTIHIALYPLNMALRKSAYLNAWKTYNRLLIRFASEHKERCFLVNVLDMHKYSNNLQEFLLYHNITLRLVPFSQVFDQTLLTSGAKQNFNDAEAEQIYQRLLSTQEGLINAL